MNAYPVAARMILSQGKLRSLAVMLIMVAAAASEAIGIGMVVPFLQLLTDPSALDNAPWSVAVTNWIGADNDQSMLIGVGIAVLVAIVGSQALGAISARASIHHARRVELNLARGLFSSYMYRPYTWYLRTNTADVSRNLVQEVELVTVRVLLPLMTMTSKALVAIMILGLLFWLNPMVTIALIITLVVLYLSVYGSIRKYLQKAGQNRDDANKDRHRFVAEAFDGIKEIRIRNIEKAHLNRFMHKAEVVSEGTAKVLTTERVAPFLFRTLAFGGLMTAVLIMLSRGVTGSVIIPIAGAFAFAGYRIMPALEEVVQSAAAIRYHHGLLDQVQTDLSAPIEEFGVEGVEQTALPFRQEICFTDVEFRYPDADAPTLCNINLAIRQGTSVALVGATGAGKSTLALLLLGLVPPSTGTIRVDDVDLTARTVRAWQSEIGYVPQDVFLLDETIAKNIAFQPASENVDLDAVREAARKAMISDFIETSLPKSYETNAGENGVRFSGGQRQRIGIARALYHNPQVLILDEATSDLDSITQTRIRESLEAVKGGLTTIVIAHRLRTVQGFDVIHVVDEGRIVASGTYNELLESSPQFQALVAAESGQTAAPEESPHTMRPMTN